MEQLLKQDPIAMGMLGKQIIQDQEYRPLTYVLTAEEEDKRIYHNLLTHEMIAINMDELDSPEIRNYFIENWYLVPKEHDDQQLVDECRAVLKLMDSAPKKIHVFQIFTTLDCNARCFYCFENRLAGSNMTIETADKVIEYMQEQADGNLIRIIWFGGEPLFNYSIIDYITDGLRERGLQFESDMMSNGLLFDSNLVNRAKNSWNLKSVQITLDGTSQIYRKIKAYVTDVRDPFERVQQNIQSLLTAKIKVRIRLNLGPHNYSDLQELTDYLCEVFKGERNLFVYVNPLFEIIEYSNEKKVFIYELVDKLNSKLDMQFGKKEKIEFTDKIVNSFCMATGREAVTILPDGKVGFCPSIIEGAFLGDIYSKEIDVKMKEEFGGRFYQEDMCRTCPIYPNCYIVSGCPNKDSKEGCDPISLKRQINKIMDKMKKKYRQGVPVSDEELSK